MDSAIRNYRDLQAWKESMKLTQMMYVATRQFPREEIYGLTSQIRRSAVSVPSNIAEGYGRKTTGELRRYLHIARGSLAEMETQLILANQFNYLEKEQYRELWKQTQRVGMLVNGLLRAIKNKSGR